MYFVKEPGKNTVLQLRFLTVCQFVSVDFQTLKLVGVNIGSNLFQSTLL